MAISHKDHDHPNTPAARAVCRKAMAARPDASPAVTAAVENHRANKTAERLLAEKAGIVKPMTTWAGVKSKGTKPKAETKNTKKPGTHLRTIGDLPDVPRMLAYGARLAWANDWTVKIGEKFNDNEARIVVDAPAGEIALVWRPSVPDGVWGVFFRPKGSSVTHRKDSVQEAFELGAMVDGM